MRNRSTLPETMRAWRVHAWGTEPEKTLKLDRVPLPEPGPGELLVRAEVIPLNLNDLERITGKNMMARPDLPVIPGMEVMGKVVAVGEGIGDWLDRRVAAMPKQATGGFAEYSICPVASAFDMPEDIALPQAGALYFPYHLAWLGLVDRAELQAGESVLVHAGAGGAGSAAIQWAKHSGARVFATAGSEAKVQLCRELGADVAINYATEDFSQIVMNETNARGVDVVFDTVGEAVMGPSMNCTAYNGRYVMIGFASDKAVADEKTIIPRRLAVGNLKLCGVLLAYADEAVAPLMKKAMGWNFCPNALGTRAMAEIVEAVRSGGVRPVIGEVSNFEGLPRAMTRLRDRLTTGRVLVIPD
ncbi:MAG: zinc-binding dehydrogenase [Myxococcota bacterium]|jgi:NADPH:quinone reductase|nr:zinc-binding dehydrogenase [Myxococcota bacterium]